MNTDYVAELLRNPDTAGTVLLTILLRTYGEDIFDVDPVELYVRIQEDFRTTMSEEGENRLNALIMALSSNAFYEDPDVFRAVAAALYDGDLGDLINGTIDDITLPEILWAIYEVGLLREDEEDPEFAPAVQRIIDEEIAQAAEEADLDNPDSVVPYYERFVEDMKEDMLQQLRRLGVL